MTSSRNERAGQRLVMGKESVGSRLRGLRKARSWTQGDLAMRSGIATSTVSKIENSQLSPSFEILLRISEGLGLDINDLVPRSSESETKTRRAVTKHGEGERHETTAYVYELLCADIRHKQLHPLIATLKAHSLHEIGTLLSHPGEEVLYVLEGEIEVHTEYYRPLRLGVGDCVYFDSTMRHGCISVSDKDAKVFWVSTADAAPA